MTRGRPALSAREHRRLADVLFGAAAAGRTLPALTTWYPDLTAADACRIRDLLLERRLADGEQVIGAKVSLRNAPTRPGEEVPKPRFAWLTGGMLLADGAVDISGLTRPRVEPKLAFRLARRLRSSVPTAGEVLAATECVLPCLDILDSRFDDNGPALEPIGPSPRGRSPVPALEAVSWCGRAAPRRTSCWHTSRPRREPGPNATNCSTAVRTSRHARICAGRFAGSARSCPKAACTSRRATSASATRC
jgi:hypothetical protein